MNCPCCGQPKRGIPCSIIGCYSIANYEESPPTVFYCDLHLRKWREYQRRLPIETIRRAREDLEKYGDRWPTSALPPGWRYQATMAPLEIQAQKSGELNIPDIRWELVPDG